MDGPRGSESRSRGTPFLQHPRDLNFDVAQLAQRDFKCQSATSAVALPDDCAVCRLVLGGECSDGCLVLGVEFLETLNMQVNEFGKFVQSVHSFGGGVIQYVMFHVELLLTKMHKCIESLRNSGYPISRAVTEAPASVAR